MIAGGSDGSSALPSPAIMRVPEWSVPVDALVRGNADVLYEENFCGDGGMLESSSGCYKLAGYIYLEIRSFPVLGGYYRIYAIFG